LLAATPALDLTPAAWPAAAPCGSCRPHRELHVSTVSVFAMMNGILRAEHIGVNTARRSR